MLQVSREREPAGGGPEVCLGRGWEGPEVSGGELGGAEGRRGGRLRNSCGKVLLAFPGSRSLFRGPNQMSEKSRALPFELCTLMRLDTEAT